jgi:hypothetical protein
MPSAMDPESCRVPWGHEEVNLERLLDAPQEHLNIEIKGWLNLADELDRANLAKAMIALA